MTLPKGSERPIATTKSRRPKGLTRMIVGQKLLRIPFYKIELVSDSTGKPDKRVNHVEIHPVEWDTRMVFAALKTAVTSVGIPITNIVDMSKVSERKGDDKDNF